MADNFGLKIGIEGEKQFKHALAEINQSFKVLGSEMQLVTSQFDKNDQSVSALSSRNAVLNKEIETQKEKITTLKAALDNAASSFGENDRRTQNWQIQLNKAQSELNGMQRELAGNEKAISDMGDGLQNAAKDSKKFGDDVQDSGKKADDAGSRFEKLGGILKGVGVAMGAAFTAVGVGAVAIGKEIASAVVSFTKNGLDYNKQMEQYRAGFSTLLGSAQNADKLLGNLSNFAAKTPFELGDLAQASQTLLAFGTAEKDIEPSLKMLGDIAMGNKEKFNGLALVFGQVQSVGKMTGQDLMQMINQGFNPLQVISEKTGESMTSLKDKMSKGQISFEMVAEAMRTATSAGGQFYNAMEGQSRTLDGQISTLQDGFNALSGAITSKFSAELTNNALPAVNGLVSGFFDLVTGQEGAKEAIQESAKQLSQSVSNMVPVITEMVGTFSTIGKELLAVLLSTLQQNLPQLLSAASQIISMLLDGIVGALPILITAAVQIVMTLLQGIIEALPQITDAALQLLMTLASGILENLPALLGAAVQVVLTLVQGIAGALPQLIPAVVEALLLVVGTIINNLPLLIDAAIALVLALVEGIQAAHPKLINAALGMVDTLITGIVDALPKLIDAAIQIITALVEYILNNLPLMIEMSIKILAAIASGLISAIGQLYTFAPKLWSALWNTITSMNWGEIGSNLLNAIKNGITGAFGSLSTAANGAVSTISDAFTGLPGEAIQWGKDLVNGIANGIRSAARAVQNAVSGIAQNIRSFLHFSVPDEGPLTDYESWMPDFLKGLADGINSNTSIVTNALNGLSRDMSLNMSPSLSFNSENRGSSPSISNIAPVKQVIQLVLDGRIVAEMLMPDISRGLETQRINLQLAKGVVNG